MSTFGVPQALLSVASVIGTTIILAIRHEKQTCKMSWVRNIRLARLFGVRSYSNSRLPPPGLRGRVPLFVGNMHLKVPVATTLGKRLIVIGDVHGCYDELMLLLDKVEYSPKSGDKLCFVGDLIGKGPKSFEVFKFVKESGEFCIRGNHEHRVVEYFYDQAGSFKESGPSEHKEMAKSMFSEQDMDWMRALPLSIKFEEYNSIVVHAGIVPGTKVEDMKPKMLMNMRKISDEGKPLIGGKAGTPWAELWKSDTTVIFGHDAVQGFKLFPNAIALDSGCVYGKELTSYVLPKKEFISVAALKLYCDPFAPKKTA